MDSTFIYISFIIRREWKKVNGMWDLIYRIFQHGLLSGIPKNGISELLKWDEKNSIYCDNSLPIYGKSYAVYKRDFVYYNQIKLTQENGTKVTLKIIK